MRTMRRVFCFLLCAAMLCVLMPAGAMAEEENAVCTKTEGCILPDRHTGNCIVDNTAEKTGVCTVTPGCTLPEGHTGICTAASAETPAPTPTETPMETPPAEQPPAATAAPIASPTPTQAPAEKTEGEAAQLQKRIDAIAGLEALKEMTEEQLQELLAEIRAISDSVGALDEDRDKLDTTKLDAAVSFFASREAEKKANAAARIGEEYFPTLQEAVDAAGAWDTIVLQRDCTEGTITIYSGNLLSIDFNGHRFTAETDGIGFDLQENCYIILKNGSITSERAKVLIQNCSSLTLEDMTLDGTRMPGPGCYALSNNCGEISLTGGTSIEAGEGNIALDVYYWPQLYAKGVRVTIDTTGTISGAVTYAAADGVSPSETSEGSALVIKNAIVDGHLDIQAEGASLEIYGGKYYEELPEKYLAGGFKPTRNSDGSYYEHTHEPGEAAKENSVEASCLTDGSYDLVVRCTICGDELSRTSVKLPALGHCFSEWKTISAPTSTADGMQQRVCATCGTTEKSSIKKGTRAHEYKWRHDETKHWCECLECGERTEEAEHSYGMWIVTKEPTETEAGEQYRECRACGFTQTMAAPAKAHVHEAVLVKAVPATCDAEGYKAYFRCECGACFKDKNCTESIGNLSERAIPALGHRDEDLDGVCDICALRLETQKRK